MKPFREVIDGIRKAVMASEVREDIAQGMEYVEQFANTAGENIKKAIDPTLSVSGKAADAAKVGEAVGSLKEEKADKTDLDTERKRIDTLNDGGLNLKDEVIDASIKTWLTDHPEATTTVQDGAISLSKLSNPLQKVIGLVTDVDIGFSATYTIPDNSVMDLNGFSIKCEKISGKNITLKNGTIYMIKGGGDSRVIFANINFRSYDGAWKRPDYSRISNDEPLDELAFNECTFDTVGIGISAVRKLIVNGCTFDNPNLVPQSIDGNHSEMLKIANDYDVLEHGYISGNTFRNSIYFDAIDLYTHGEHCIISGNVFYNCLMGLEIKYETHNAEQAETIKQLIGSIIANNLFINCYGNAFPIRMDTKPYNGIYKKSPIVIFRNNIFDNENNAIQECYVFTGGTPANISGDIVINNTNKLLVFASTSTKSESSVLPITISQCSNEFGTLIKYASDAGKCVANVSNCVSRNILIFNDESEVTVDVDMELYAVSCTIKQFVPNSTRALHFLSSCKVESLSVVAGKLSLINSNMDIIDGSKSVLDVEKTRLFIGSSRVGYITPKLKSYKNTVYNDNFS